MGSDDPCAGPLNGYDSGVCSSGDSCGDAEPEDIEESTDVLRGACIDGTGLGANLGGRDEEGIWNVCGEGVGRKAKAAVLIAGCLCRAMIAW